MKFLHILFIVFIFSSRIVVAQENNEDPNSKLDKKFTPNQNSIFNVLKKNNTTNVFGNSDITIKNCVKYSPSALLRQKAIFYYEFELFEGFSGCVGLGKAFGEDLFQKAYLNSFIGLIDEITVKPSDIFRNSVYSGSNLFVSAAAKIYVSGETFDEDFVQFSYSRERLDYTLNDKIDDYIVEGTDKEVSFKMNGFNFGYGYNFLVGNQKNFSHEFFMGFGVKFISYSRIERINNTNPSSPYYPKPTFIKTDTELKARIIPSLNLSYTFGFGF